MRRFDFAVVTPDLLIAAQPLGILGHLCEESERQLSLADYCLEHLAFGKDGPCNDMQADHGRAFRHITHH